MRGIKELDLAPLKKVTHIAEQYGIAIDTWRFSDLHSGCLWKSLDGWRIVVNSAHAPTRRTFSIAHELGHFFLHRTHTDIYFSCQYGSYSRIEREANQFAANLLMPRRMMAGLRQRKMTVPEMAGLLKLSQDTVNIRMGELGWRVQSRKSGGASGRFAGMRLP